jgi:hypothetical protein
MIEEHRDPDLESIRAEWEPPPASPEFRTRLGGAYEKEFGRVPWWRRWPVAAAVAAAGLFLAVALTRPSGAGRYQPVNQPHFTIVSAGEHP